jgi:hypothetical protein
MLSFTNMFDLFTHELTSLSGRGAAGAFGVASSLECGFAGHRLR